MTIPVIVLNYNSSSDCLKCISSLQEQKEVELEIIIIDNNSPQEGEKEAIAQLAFQKGCTFIQAQENKGYNAGNNIGLRYAASKGYEYALIANPDMVFAQSDSISRLAAKMKDDSEIVVCGTNILNYDGTVSGPRKRDNWTSSYEWIIKIFAAGNKPSAWIDNPQYSHYCSYLEGCCLMLRMDFIQSIGFFDEGVFLYCEELILSRQVEKAGKKMYYLSEAKAFHNHIESRKSDVLKRFKALHKSRIYYYNTYSLYTPCQKLLAVFFSRLHVIVVTTVKRLKQIKRKLFKSDNAA